MKKAVKLFILGIVQGVFFRAYIKENADRLGLKGYVRNLEDGKVEAFIQGDSDKVNEMIERCRQGPKFSQIKSVEVKEEKLQELNDFLWPDGADNRN